MDSEVQRDGRVLDLTDDAWREDRLPYEDVTIPLVMQFLINYIYIYSFSRLTLRSAIFCRRAPCVQARLALKPHALQSVVYGVSLKHTDLPTITVFLT